MNHDDEGLMRSRKKQTYSFEFKLYVVELYLTSEVSFQELTLSQGINSSGTARFPFRCWKYCCSLYGYITLILIPFFISKQKAAFSLSEFPLGLQQSKYGLPISSMPEMNLSNDKALVLLSMWGLGFFIFTIWQVYGYRIFVRKLQKKRSFISEDSKIFKQLILMKKKLGIKNKVQLAYSSVVRSPVLVIYFT